MKYVLSTHNFELSQTDIELLEKKLQRIQKLLTPPFIIDVHARHDTHHRNGAVLTCRVNISMGKALLYAERTGETFQIALDEALEAVRSELEREHTKRQKHSRNRKRLPLE